MHGFDRTALASVYHETMAQAVPSALPHAYAVWPYTRFGTPAAIVDRKDIPGTGATRVTFANGVKLNVKTTKFEDQAVHVGVQFGAGYRNIVASQATVLKAFAQIGLFEGGLGKLESKDIGDALNGRQYGFSFGIGEQATGMGATPFATILRRRCRC